MKRDAALQILRDHKPELAARYGVARLGLFGSVAKDQATEGSDVDAVVEMRKPDLFFLAHIKAVLEEALPGRGRALQRSDECIPQAADRRGGDRCLTAA
jgi:hypothetical protein